MMSPCAGSHDSADLTRDVAPSTISAHRAFCERRITSWHSRSSVSLAGLLTKSRSLTSGIRFCSTWTLLWATVFLAFVLNVRLSAHVIVSLLSQAIWILLTWAMWIAATATMNRALPLIPPKARCAGADFCTQLQASFGKLLRLTH